MNDASDNNAVTPAPWPEWLKWLLWTVLAAGGIYLLAKVMRRGGGAGVLMAAVAPAVAMAAGRSAVPLDSTDLVAALREVADQEPVIPPALLLAALRDRGVPFTSEQQMARALRPLNLRSQVRTVTGRPERRWYDLTEYANHG